MDTVPRIAASCGVPLFDYQNTGKGLLIAIGSGLMMATMDEIGTLRYASEFTKQERENPHYGDFLALASHYLDFVCVHAWFSISKPDALAKILSNVPETKLVYKANADLGRGRRFGTFSEISAYLGNPEFDPTVKRQRAVHLPQCVQA